MCLKTYLMKTIYSIVFSVFVLLTACKKEDGTPESHDDAQSYKMTAPACLIETDSSSSVWGRNYYDSQRRIAMRCERRNYDARDSVISTYTYGTNTITVASRIIPRNGSETIKTMIHYLNTMGLIDSTVGEFINYTYSSIHYIHDNSGYLIRSINYVGTQPRSGNSFQYTGGNLTSIYQLNFDFETSILTDSSLNNSFTYYEELAGKTEAASAWNNRTGRANTNARKNVLDRNSSVVISYTYIHENGLPTQQIATYGGNSWYTWKCY